MHFYKCTKINLTIASMKLGYQPHLGSDHGKKTIAMPQDINMQHGRFGFFFPIVNAQISAITAGFKADLKKNPLNQSDYNLPTSLLTMESGPESEAFDNSSIGGKKTLLYFIRKYLDF